MRPHNALARGRIYTRRENRGAGFTAAPPMKATDLLKKEHRAIRDLFAKYRRAPRGRKVALLAEVRREVRLHFQIEAEVFYPALRRLGTDESADLVYEALAEHRIVKELMADLALRGPADPDFDSRVDGLRETVEHHAGEEEAEVFREARKHIPAVELLLLGKEMEDLKRSLAA